MYKNFYEYSVNELPKRCVRKIEQEKSVLLYIMNCDRLELFGHNLI